MIACVAPNPSIDRHFACAAVVPGAIHRPDALVLRPGGKGLNVARGAHALGADVRPVALLAGHAGRWVAEALAAEGLEAGVVWAAGETRSSLSVAAGGAMTEFYERGDPPGAAAWSSFGAAVAAAAEAADWVSFSGSMPPGVDPGEAAALVAAARAAGARVAVDQHGPTLDAALRGGPDVVKVNVHEARELTGAGDAAGAARALAARQRAAGVQRPVTAVTLGEEGALLLTPDGAVLRAGLHARGPYPVGSGDAFLAGLLVAAPPAPDGGWAPALALALGAGAANAEVAGAASFDPRRARTLAVAVDVREA
jgi:1-phosphofructokinase family hexose kinase